MSETRKIERRILLVEVIDYRCDRCGIVPTLAAKLRWTGNDRGVDPEPDGDEVAFTLSGWQSLPNGWTKLSGHCISDQHLCKSCSTLVLDFIAKSGS